MNQSEALSSAAGSPREFNTTHWSVVLQAGRSQSPQSAAALERLCRTYWYPLYAFIRRKGYREEDAQDFTQEFFARLLERNDFEAVDPSKGKFRTFLLTALTHFLSNERDRTQAAKRGGGQAMISLDEFKPEEIYRFEPVSDLSPDTWFDLRWAMTVLEQALAQLRADLATAPERFDALKVYLTDEADEGDYTATAQRLSMSSQAVAVAVHRMRQRYRELVRAEVAHTVSNPMDVEAEMRHLYAVLNQ